MAFNITGTLTTDKRTIDDTQTWDTQTDWEAYQSKTNIDITNGVLSLSQLSPITRYDAQALSLSDGQIIDPFPDEIGTNDATAIGGPVYNASSINTNPTSDYDGNDDGHNTTIQVDTSTPATFGVVFKLDTGTAGLDLIFGASDTGEGQFIQFGSDGSNNWQLAYGDASDVGNTTPSDTNPHILFIVADGSSASAYLDGSLLYTINPVTGALPRTLMLGGRNEDGTLMNYSDSRIGEWVYYDTNLSDSNRQYQEQQLSTKWGITI